MLRRLRRRDRMERLDARPTAELCIDCKTLDEIREKQMG
jgi:DnaK suppressor protein